MLAYRCFRVRKGELYSIYVPYAWQVDGNEAECTGDFFRNDGDDRCEEPPNAEHIHGCGLYARVDLDMQGWRRRCTTLAKPIWPFKEEQIVLGLVWAGGHIIEHLDRVIRAQRMEVLLLSGWPNLQPRWRDRYVEVPAKGWELAAESALKASLAEWLRQPAKATARG